MTRITSRLKIFALKNFQLKMDRFWANLQLPKFKIKKPAARAECHQIPKMGQIICFYVNTHVLKSEASDFMILKHRLGACGLGLYYLAIIKNT